MWSWRLKRKHVRLDKAQKNLVVQYIGRRNPLFGLNWELRIILYAWQLGPSSPKVGFLPDSGVCRNNCSRSQWECLEQKVKCSATAMSNVRSKKQVVSRSSSRCVFNDKVLFVWSAMSRSCYLNPISLWKRVHVHSVVRRQTALEACQGIKGIKCKIVEIGITTLTCRHHLIRWRSSSWIWYLNKASMLINSKQNPESGCNVPQTGHYSYRFSHVNLGRIIIEADFLQRC
jgi:hypothetical protein